ncbi:MAG: 1-(5-phosphoribosyl)-5-[(5-phosphoribosylamino)methylideneamino]imidazole-4-carboxamide isomerase [Lachnospiraceae bacterium]|nr:1-(5-phosphoribosyl)-5-[(5-phosphoribosylamino)methylideneamino]imidazole-4-carboxamide isomerase [Lachnospiraceae bacterium]
MKLYPAIDIKGGKCVRLKQGDFDQVTVYNEDPLVVARDWKAKGAEFIHVIDLDGARSGESPNLQIIRNIVDETGLFIQTGGGIRSLEAINSRIEAGVGRVIIGTRAVNEPEFVREAIKKFGADRIVVGLDGHGEYASVAGWEQDSDKTILDLAHGFEKMGVKTIIYTDISRDGMLTGPNIIYTEKLINETNIDIIASGGIGSPLDLELLQEIGASGAILGKSLYEGKIDLKDAILRFAD